MIAETQRITYCGFRVDETIDEQKASHKLREAAFCPRCVKYAMLIANKQVCWTATGKRRHYAMP